MESLTINKQFAAKYKRKKEAEELSKCTIFYWLIIYYYNSM